MPAGIDRAAIDADLPAGLDLPVDAAKAAAETRIERLLCQIEEKGREPDVWEGQSLVYAVGLVAAGMYSAASVYVGLAATPEEQRSLVVPLSDLARPTVRQLRHALNEVQSIPPVDFR